MGCAMSLAETIEIKKSIYRATPRWPADVNALMVRLVLDGVSSLETAKQINKAFPHLVPYTRNAVIGRCERLGIVRPQGHARATRKAIIAVRNIVKAQAKAREVPAPVIPPVTPPAPAVEPVKIAVVQREMQPQDDQMLPGVRLIDLQSWHCRWPLGDPRSDDFRFCGCQKAIGSYCEHHARIACQSVSTRARQFPRREAV